MEGYIRQLDLDLFEYRVMNELGGLLIQCSTEVKISSN